MFPFSNDKWEVGDINVVECGPIIVGGGPSGLATAACLKQKGIPSLILEKSDCIGSLWRYRTYDRIHLHLPKRFCELPLLPVDRNYPDSLTSLHYVHYLETYARRFQLCPRFNEHVISASHDESTGWWKVCTVNRERGNFRKIQTYSARWLVVASGENAEPQVPCIEDVRKFKGIVLHSCSYKNGATFKDANVLIVGCGNSGMEIALDLAYFGAKPSIVLRGHKHILPAKMLCVHTYTIISTLLKVFSVWMVDMLLLLGAWWVLGNTDKYGLKRHTEGPLSIKNRLRKTPVLDTGAYRLIKNGDIKVLPGVARFTEKGAEFTDGCSEDFDAVVFATGYRINVREWLFSEVDLFTPEGIPKSPSPESWKGRKGLYMVGLSGAGIPGVWIESQRIAHDIEQHLRSEHTFDSSFMKDTHSSKKNCSH